MGGMSTRSDIGSLEVDSCNQAGGGDAGAPWRLRFWSVFTGQAFSLLGSALTQFVLLWWITDTTSSVSALATAGMAALLPQALLGPLGGTFADRYSRRLLMIGADAISALCMIFLIVVFLTNRIELWHVYVMMCVRSAMQAFQAPAAAASMSMLVPRSFLPRAAGLVQTLQGLTTVAAAPLGALAMALMPMGWALGIDVLTAVLGISPLLIFGIPQIRHCRRRAGGILQQLCEGIGVVWHNPGLRRLYALLGAVVLVIMPSFTLVPLLVKEHFAGGAPQVALMEGLGGVGMVIGGLVIASIAPRRQVPWILWGFAVSCIALALTPLVPAHLFGLAVAWWVVSGLTFILGNAPLTALLQMTVPNHLQGRVLSLLTTVMGLAAPIGLAMATPLGEWFGVRWLFVGMGVLGAMVSIAGFLSPTLLRLDRPFSRIDTGEPGACL